MKNDSLENTFKQNQYQEYLNEFKKEIETSSDRGIVLTCGSIMDVLLTDILKSFLVQTDKIDKDLFKVNGPLATFDSKIKMSFYLGLISKNEVDNLTFLQRVRNKFAHQIVNISFENNDIANICKNFKIPKNGYLPSEIPLPNKQTGELPTVDLNPIKKDTSAKDRFIYTFQYLFLNFGKRIMEKLGKRKEYDVIYTADTTITKTICIVEEDLEEYRSLLNQRNKILENKIKSLETLKESEDSNSDKVVKLEEEITEIKESIDKSEKEYENSEKILQPMMQFYKYTLAVVKNSMIDFN